MNVVSIPLSRSTITANIAENPLMPLLDYGALQICMKVSVAKNLGLILYGSNTVIGHASNEAVAQTIGFVDAPLEVGTKVCCAIKFGVVKNQCADIILGQDFLSNHRVVFKFNGDCDSLSVRKKGCNLASVKHARTTCLSEKAHRNIKKEDVKFL
uniref:uncharacterized protein LOC120346128 n=1 Tax=Styela clava TaxID=7725 RepID=UPI00193AD927|nr:uncharacterized protein LOC120346128 [Styela clava]